MRRLPLSEASRLAVFFEEEARHQHKKMKELEARAGAPTTPASEGRVVNDFSDPDEEYAFEDEDDGNS